MIEKDYRDHVWQLFTTLIKKGEKYSCIVIDKISLRDQIIYINNMAKKYKIIELS